MKATNLKIFDDSLLAICFYDKLNFIINKEKHREHLLKRGKSWENT